MAIRSLDIYEVELPGLPDFRIPHAAAARLAEFCQGNMTGNITLNIKNGEIMAAKVEEFMRFDPPGRKYSGNGKG